MRRLLTVARAVALTALVLSLALLAGAGGVGAVTIPAGYATTLDDAGANDVPGQVDVTQMGRNDTDPTWYKIFWGWDSTDSWTGNGQTGDACALFDTDADGYINYVVCGQVTNPGADPNVVKQTSNSPWVFSCSDKRIDRCSNPSPVSYTYGTHIVAGALTSGIPTRDANLIANIDPFASGSNYPNDSTLQVNILKTFIPGNETLVNVCSYPSAGNGGNNNPFDCVITPGAGYLKIVKTVSSGPATSFSFRVAPGPTSADDDYSVASGATGQTITLQPSTQSVTETVPAGWSLDSVVCQKDGGTATGSWSAGTNVVTGVVIESLKTTTCTFTNSQILGSIEITKQDEVGNPLAGAVFTLYVDTEPYGAPRESDDNVAASPAKTCTTAANGKCTISSIPLGHYWVVETTTPSGYATASDQAVNVTNSTLIQLTFTNPRTYKMIVLVCDEVTDTLYASNVSFGGAAAVQSYGSGGATVADSSLCALLGAYKTPVQAGTHSISVAIPTPTATP